MKTKFISPGLIFLTVNLFATLFIIAFAVKEKFPEIGTLPLTYEQSFRNWFADFSWQRKVERQIPPPKNDLLEKQLKEAGLVNVSTLDNSILVDLKYSTTDNFLLLDVYGDLNDCYLQKDAAEKLVKAQKILQEKYPFYRIVVFDGVRPLSIQKTMWNALKIPYEEKSKFITSPWEKSLHNFGEAVDVSIVNSNGWETDMGTPYDYFGELGYPREEEKMLKDGKLLHRHIENRKLLRDVMTKAGFMPISTEWWHFNSCTRAEAEVKYKVIE